MPRVPEGPPAADPDPSPPLHLPLPWREDDAAPGAPGATLQVLKHEHPR
jgi:hypothetical protein